MRGHENILKIRAHGLRPAGHVRLADYPVRHVDWRYSDEGAYPLVCTAGDAVDALDLRFLLGLPVHIDGEDIGRVRKLAQKARAAGAAMVVAFVDGKGAIWTKGDTQWLSF